MAKLISPFESRSNWLSWRREGIGSSDCAAVLNCSPYKKRHQLFKEKTTGESVEITNPAMDRGNELEPIAREKFAVWYNWEFNTDEVFNPINLEHDTAPYLKASLDGLSVDGLTLIEIKYQGDEMHESGVIKPHYMVQMQHQFLVSGAREGYFVSINNAKQIISKRVLPDEHMMARISNECALFWDDVLAGKMSSENFDPEIIHKFREYERLGLEIKNLQTLRDALTVEIFESGVEMAAGYQVVTQTRKGSVRYADIPQLDGLDLEAYRGADITFKQIKKMK